MKTPKARAASHFRLFKRLAPTQVGREAPYYFRFTFRGTSYARCLETNDAGEAQRRAKLKYQEITQAVITGEYTRLDGTKLRAENAASLSDLCAAYRTGPAEASAATRTLNIHALKQIVGTAQCLDELTPAVARQWFASVQLAVLNLLDQEAAASLKRSANSRWTQAKSLFTDRCLAHYQDLSLINGPADLEAFVRAGDAARFNRIPKQNYNPPTEQVIANTLARWEELEDRDLFLAIGHELAFGLRKGEIEQACWSWHTQRNGYPVLDGRATVKSGSGLVQVQALDPFYTILMGRVKACNWCPDPKDSGPDAVSDLIVTGTVTYRTDDLFRAVSAWLRALGWKTKKTNHALRAYAGCQVGMRYGIYAAQTWLRHSSVKVTEQHYSHFVTQFKPQNLDAIPARWAVVPEPAKLASQKSDGCNFTSPKAASAPAPMPPEFPS